MLTSCHQHNNLLLSKIFQSFCSKISVNVLYFRSFPQLLITPYLVACVNFYPLLSPSISPCWITLNLNELYSAAESKETYQLLHRLSYITTCHISAIHLSSTSTQTWAEVNAIIKNSSSRVLSDWLNCGCYHAWPNSFPLPLLVNSRRLKDAARVFSKDPCVTATLVHLFWPVEIP